MWRDSSDIIEMPGGWRLDPRAPGEHKGLIYRAPVINIARNPYWGRNHEAWGEDPYLTGGMAVAYVRGLQGDDPHYLKLAATLKHYAVNNVEAGRTELDAVVPEAAIEVMHDRGCDVVGVGRVATKIDNEEGFSGGASVKLDAQALGEFIEFAVPVPETGEYELKLEYKSFPSRGVYQLSIDGAPQGELVDMYEAKDRYGRSASLGTKLLDAGVRTVRFTLNGKNAASAGFSGHFDKLTLVGKHTLTFECESLKAATGGPGERDGIARAAELARGADVAVVCIGTDARVEHESRDRQQLGLPGAQEELVKAVLAANPRTIVVQMSAGPLTVPWSKEHVPAMLQAWWSGEEGGRAIADVLFGDVNPAGRLPHTVYASEAQVPPQDEYDISKGFTYMYVKGEPLYPFGHGLSYTAFEYADLRTSGPPLTVTATVKNTGSRAGDEVAQLYLAPPGSDAPRPRLMLHGFQRVHLRPGESKQVRFTVPDEKLAFWNTAAKRFEVQHGEWGVQIGASSADIRLQTKVVP
jgi:hypothetical protein